MWCCSDASVLFFLSATKIMTFCRRGAEDAGVMNAFSGYARSTHLRQSLFISTYINLPRRTVVSMLTPSDI